MIKRLHAKGSELVEKNGSGKVIGYATLAMLVNIYAVFGVISYLILTMPA